MNLFKKKPLTAAAIAGAVDIPTLELDVPQWGGSIILRGFSGLEKVQFEVEFNKIEGDDANFKKLVLLLSKVIVDETGAKIFDSEDGRKTLADKHAEVLMNIFEAWETLNGQSKKAQEQIEKN